jgi:hypothetical protein
MPSSLFYVNPLLMLISMGLKILYSFLYKKIHCAAGYMSIRYAFFFANIHNSLKVFPLLINEKSHLVVLAAWSAWLMLELSHSYEEQSPLNQ